MTQPTNRKRIEVRRIEDSDDICVTANAAAAICILRAAMAWGAEHAKDHAQAALVHDTADEILHAINRLG